MDRALLAARSLGLLAAVPALGAGLCAWQLAGAFPLDDPTWLAGMLPGLIGLGLGLGAAFAPWDRPSGAWAWSAPLEGLAVGIGGLGLLVFPHSFLLFTPLLLLWACGLAVCAEAVREGVADLGGDATSSGGNKIPGQETPEAAEVRLRRRRLLRALGAAAGVALVLLWRPAPAGARPAPLAAQVAAIVSRPSDVQRDGRVWREGLRLFVRGEGVELTVQLDRPAIDGVLQGQPLHLEPCLYIEQGASDGFFPLGPLNGYRGEARGLARCEWVEGERRAWIELEWPRGEAFGSSSLGASWLGWGAHLSEALSARVELEVDLETGGLLRVDALTRLGRPLEVHAATLGWLRLDTPTAPRLTCGLEDGFDTTPPAREEKAPWEQLVCEPEVVRAIRAQREARGPWQVLSQGRFEDWLCVSQGERRLLIVCPDWAAQAATGPSPSAGHGLPQNGLLYWRQGNGTNLLWDVGSSRLGPGPRASTLPAGLYRNRISLLPLHPDASTRGRALRERERLLTGS